MLGLWRLRERVASLVRQVSVVEWGVLLCIVALSVVYHASYVRAWYDPFNATDIDEIGIYYEMRQLVFHGTPASQRRLAGYPPVVLFVHWLGHAAVAIPAGDWNASYALEAINLMRWWSILPATIATLLIYAALRFFVSISVAATATIVFILSPLIILERTNAITEPWQLLFIAGTLVSFFIAMRDQSVRASVICAVLGCLAVAAKYSNFPILGLGMSAALWLFIHNRRKGIISSVMQVLIIGGIAGLLLFVYDARYLLSVREPNNFLSGGNVTYTNWASFLDMLYTVAKQFTLPNQMALIGLIAASAFWLPRASSWQRYALVMIGIVIISFAVVTLMYTIFWALVNRYLIPLTVLITLSIGLGLQGVLIGVDRIFQHLTHSKQWAPTFRTALLVLATTVWMSQPISRWLAQPHNLPRIEHQVVSWLQNRYYDETLLISNDIYQVVWFYFDREYSGYKGKLPPWYRGVLSDQSISTWRDMYIRYVWMYPESRNAIAESHPEYFDHITLLRHFRAYPHSGWDGIDVYIYELVDLQPDAITFNNGLQIMGWAERHCKQENGVLSVNLAPYWRTEQPQATNLQLFLHVTPVGSSRILQQVDQPAASDDYPMLEWEMEDAAIRGRPVSLRTAVPPGSAFQVIVGLYDLDTLQRVPLRDGREFAVVCHISPTQYDYHPSSISSRSS